MWSGKSLAVILPTYNEAESIRDCIDQFARLPVVDQVIVVNNNAHADTTVEVGKTSALEVHERVQGYGAAIRRGLAETASFDLVCICEPDGTFDPKDIHKLLPFLSDTEVVLGSRTVSTFIFDGANMGPLLRWGNWFVAKLIEVLFDTSYLSDVGCTFRVLTRHAIDQLEPELREVGSALGLEMLVSVVRLRIPFTQVPVRYLPRVGESSVTGKLTRTIPLGLEMIGIVLRERGRSWGTNVPRRTSRRRMLTDAGSERH